MSQKTIIALAVAAALTLHLTGCGKAPDSAAPAASAQTETVALKSGIELGNLDTQMKPQQDFFRYVNGNWLAKTEIPADKSRWGSFDELRYNAEKHVLELVQQQAAKPADIGTDAQKIGDLYRAFMDTAAIDALGLTPLNADIAAIDALKTPAELAVLWGKLQPQRYGTPVTLFVGQDQKKLHAVHQSGESIWAWHARSG